jgi:dehydrogenase/reductase SDR family member 7B
VSSIQISIFAKVNTLQPLTVYWITGASSGIGEALALQLAKPGNALILSGRNLEALEKLKTACELRSAPTVVLAFDMIEIDSFQLQVEKAISFFGHIDVLVNNAGNSQRSLAIETPEIIERKIMELNYFAPVSLSKALLPHFIERKKGHIVVISSIAGKFGYKLRSSYAAAKHALLGYFEALRLELIDVPVHVTIVCPGRIKTNISFSALKSDGTAHGKMDDGQYNGLSSERCAAIIDRAIQQKKYEILIGKSELIPVYLKRFCPPLFYYLIKRVKTN